MAIQLWSVSSWCPGCREHNTAGICPSNQLGLQLGLDWLEGYLFVNALLGPRCFAKLECGLGLSKQHGQREEQMVSGQRLLLCLCDHTCNVAAYFESKPTASLFILSGCCSAFPTITSIWWWLINMVWTKNDILSQRLLLSSLLSLILFLWEKKKWNCKQKLASPVPESGLQPFAWRYVAALPAPPVLLHKAWYYGSHWCTDSFF